MAHFTSPLYASLPVLALPPCFVHCLFWRFHPLRLIACFGALQGPLQDMGPVELRHFCRTAAVRAAAAAAAAAQATLTGGGPGRPKKLPVTREAEARTVRGVLPQDHDKRVDALLSRAVAAVERSESAVATRILSDMMEEEEASISQVNPSPEAEP